MGRVPAIIIVARHGARLDAADPQWHLTSPTPYDPPLTYGGWRQSQALGARIASIIQLRENAGDEPYGTAESSDSSTRSSSRTGRRRKHRVIIHSSPFLRCIQTSVAISAGMRQYDPTEDVQKPQAHSLSHALHSGDPQVRQSPRLSAIPEPVAEGTSRRRRDVRTSPLKDPRPWMRVDAFLSEWMSPDYFEDITPPPGSKLMVASAKAELLRRADPMDGFNLTNHKDSGNGNFPGGWNSGARTPTIGPSQPRVDESALEDLSSIGQALPKLGRAHSHHLGNTPKFVPPRAQSRSNHSPPVEHARYEAPTPSYAISPSQPIPRGYFAHARDACVNVDYQWDSMRAPLGWPDGGQFGEEWSTMHKRFRRGLNDMIQWYREQKSLHTPKNNDIDHLEELDINAFTGSQETDEDGDVDTVLVLVTHSAGCNALIGALTNQPVLVDVATASLTMAVRKKKDYKRLSFAEGYQPYSYPRRRSLADTGIPEDYEVKVVASTEHLRNSSRFMGSARSQRAPSLPVRDKSPYRYERHVGSSHRQSSPVRDLFEPKLRRVPSKEYSPRSSIVAISSSPPPVTTSPGLWSLSSPITAPSDTANVTNSAQVSSPINEKFSLPESVTAQKPVKMAPFDGSHRKLLNTDKASVNGDADSPTAGLMAPSGLWGTAPQALATERDKGSKRRWTLGQA